MAPVFVNTVIADRAVMLESVRAALRFRRRNLDVPFCILAALCLVWGTLFLIRGIWYFFVPYLLSVFFVAYVMLSYRFPMLKLLAAIKGCSPSSNSGMIEFNTLFSESSIDIRIDGESHFLTYSSVSALIESENLLTLVIGDKSFTPVSVPINKSALSVEQKIEFLLFLRRKNPGMRILLQHKKKTLGTRKTFGSGKPSGPSEKNSVK